METRNTGTTEVPTKRWSGPLPSWSEPERIAVPCQICSAASSEIFSFEQYVAFFFIGSERTTEGRWCPACAIAVGRHVQTLTALTGWLGLRAAIYNIGIITENAIELRRAAKMPAVIPTAETRSPGLPVTIRYIAIVLAFAAAIAAVAAVISLI